MKINEVGPDAKTVTNESGGKQSDTPFAPSLIPPIAALEVSRVLKPAAIKYGAWNWKNIKSGDHLDHAMQHIFAHIAGDESEVDELEHARHAACRILFWLEKLVDEQNNTKSEPINKPTIIISDDLSAVFIDDKIYKRVYWDEDNLTVEICNAERDIREREEERTNAGKSVKSMLGMDEKGNTEPDELIDDSGCCTWIDGVLTRICTCLDSECSRYHRTIKKLDEMPDYPGVKITGIKAPEGY